MPRAYLERIGKTFQKTFSGDGACSRVARKLTSPPISWSFALSALAIAQLPEPHSFQTSMLIFFSAMRTLTT